MNTQKKIEKSDLEMRASWLAWRYGLDEERLLVALERTKVTIDYELPYDFFNYLKFEPSLVKALLYWRPEVALRLFEEGDMEQISKLLELIDRIAGHFDMRHHSIEEQCLWEAESYFLPY